MFAQKPALLKQVKVPYRDQAPIMTSNDKSLSVLMSTYERDNVEHLRSALDSLARQTLKADEVILVEDGPISDAHRELIEQFRDQLNIVSVKIPQNVGLGPALRQGLLQCKSPIIARMDTDDIALPTRFSEQYDFLINNPEVAIVGGHIAEFDNDPDKPLGIRKIKTTHEEIVRASWFRTPFNHMTVMYHKDAIITAGNYKHLPGFEDYDLWLRLIASDYQCRNMDKVLVLARVGNGLLERRSGWNYISREAKAVSGFRKYKVIPLPALYINLIGRLVIRILPRKVLGIAYRKLRTNA